MAPRRITAAATLVTLGAAALVLHNARQRPVVLEGRGLAHGTKETPRSRFEDSAMAMDKAARQQQLFTLNDFSSGRVEFPSQNLANGAGDPMMEADGLKLGAPHPASNGADHAHVMWAQRRRRGFQPFVGGQKLFSIDDFDRGRVSFPEEGMRSRNQVVKSLETNIEPAGRGRDHVWEHQVSHGPVPYEQWPLEMPGVGDGATAAAPSPRFPEIGMRAPTTQLSGVPPAVRSGQLALSWQLDAAQRNAALSLDGVGNELKLAATEMLGDAGRHNRGAALQSRVRHARE